MAEKGSFTGACTVYTLAWAQGSGAQQTKGVLCADMLPTLQLCEVKKCRGFHTVSLGGSFAG
jgi:hypothetical protein